MTRKEETRLRTQPFKEVTFALLLQVILCIGGGYLVNLLLEEMQRRDEFEKTVEREYRVHDLVVGNADLGASFGAYFAEELEALTARAKQPQAPPIRYVQANQRQVNLDDPDAEDRPESSEVPQDVPNQVQEDPTERDFTEQIGSNKIATPRTPMQSDYVRTFMRAVDRYQEDAHFFPHKEDRYASFIELNSYEKTAGYLRQSTFSLVTGLFMCLGVCAGAAGALMKIVVRGYLEIIPSRSAMASVYLQPLVGAVVSALTGFSLLFLVTGILPTGLGQVHLSIPVTVYGIAFFMAMNPYNSARSLHVLLLNQVEILAMAEKEVRSSEVLETSPPDANRRS